MKPCEAAKVFREITSTLADLAPRMREAKKTLNKHFDAAGIDELDGVRRAVDVRQQLDTDKVREHLGERVGEFLKPVTSRTLFVDEPGGPEA